MSKVIDFKSLVENSKELATDVVANSKNNEQGSLSADEFAKFLADMDIRRVGQAVPMTSDDGLPACAIVVHNKDYDGVNYSVIAFLKDESIEKYVKGEIDIDNPLMNPTLLVVRVNSATEFKFLSREEYDTLIYSTDISTDIADSETVLGFLNKLLIISINDTIERLGLKIEPKFYRRGDK